jgi:hypothetical protein
MKKLKFAHVIEKKIGYEPLNNIPKTLVLEQLPCILAGVWS